MPLASSQWTDEQEIALLKAIVKWKPVGMHRHFRMLSIRGFMLSEGVVNIDDEHTKIPGLWKKLETLYDLPALNEREDATVNDVVDQNGMAPETGSDFDLPRDEFGGLMFERRLAPEGTHSPEMQFSRRESTVADTDEPRSSPAPPRGLTRNARASVRKGRTSRLQMEVEDSRRTSKATSVTEDEKMEDVGEDEDNEDDEDDEDTLDDGERAKSKRWSRGARRGGARHTAKRARRR